ncbi:MAG: CarD family transcriptional regulator, partial [Deltaproteobacteria bacterium]|nr:CarD family transcriptional regulator [Deltaproteobacteria bacterium]
MAKSSAANTFKIGDLAVYPAHGVAVIENLEDRSISGQAHSFYILRVLESNATIMVPVANAAAVGLRKVMKKAMVPKVYSILKEKRDLLGDNQT